MELKFTTKTIDLRTSGQSIRQRAKVSGHLAYHAEITITHVPTGRALPFYPESEAQAKRAIEALNKSGVDLSKTEFSADEARLMREILSAVTRRA